MKTRLVILISSFVLSLFICLFSSAFVHSSMDTVIEKAEDMEMLLEKNDTEKAFDTALKLKEDIEKRESILEGLVPHEDLHDLSVQIADAGLSIKIGDLDDCKKAIELMKENAEHLIKHESFLIGNIF